MDGNRQSLQAPLANGLQLAQLLGALSYALDLTEGQPEGHCVRCCWIGMRIGAAAALEPAQLQDLYFTLLLKDLGCSSNAARICQLYLCDDRRFKRDFKRVGATRPEVVRFVLGQTGAQEDLATRLRGILNIFHQGGRIARELIETRCQRGAQIALQLRFAQPVADGIQSLDEHWDGGGNPAGRAGAAIPMGARIALLAQVIDVFNLSGGPQSARAEVQRRAGSWFDPRLASVFDALAQDPDFWRTLASPQIDRIVLDMEPARASRAVDDNYLDDIAAAFGQVVDAKSPYTSGHSTRVAHYADAIAESLGLTPARRRWLRRGALLHDLGKLGVSNAILDKPGKLGDAEWEAMRRHPGLTQEILSRIGPFGELALVAGAHHERLDGKGYPQGLDASQITLETRIITTADIFDALTADRPYRAALPIRDALALMAAMMGTALDPRCLWALKEAVWQPGLQGPATPPETVLSARD